MLPSLPSSQEPPTLHYSKPRESNPLTSILIFPFCLRVRFVSSLLNTNVSISYRCSMINISYASVTATV
jgi:hypothetical protein